MAHVDTAAGTTPDSDSCWVWRRRLDGGGDRRWSRGEVGGARWPGPGRRQVAMPGPPPGGRARATARCPRIRPRPRWPRLDGHGKLGCMSDSGTAVSVPAADPACDVAHGKAPLPASTRTLVAVFVSPVARFLLSYARDSGYWPVLVDPDAGLLAGGNGADHHGAEHHGPEHHRPGPEVLDGLAALDGLTTVTALAGLADEATDVVVTDHHRPELGPVLRDALASPARWVGILGNPRHPAPHVPALALRSASSAPAGRGARRSSTAGPPTAPLAAAPHRCASRQQRGRDAAADQSGSSAVASISTTAAGSSRPLTSSRLIAG